MIDDELITRYPKEMSSKKLCGFFFFYCILSCHDKKNLRGNNHKHFYVKVTIYLVHFLQNPEGNECCENSDPKNPINLNPTTFFSDYCITKVQLIWCTRSKLPRKEVICRKSLWEHILDGSNRRFEAYFPRPGIVTN